MSAGSHFTCRCVTPEPFSGKVRFNLIEKLVEGIKGGKGHLRGSPGLGEGVKNKIV